MPKVTGSQIFKPHNASRREFLRQTASAASVFLLATYIPVAHREIAQEAAQIPQGVFDPNVFLKISGDKVTVLSKKFEMGQGATTMLATLIAEELDADWSQMRFEFAPHNLANYKNLIYGVMATGGSTSTNESYDQMRQVGAAARAMFVSAAAGTWRVPPTEITVSKGVVRHAKTGKSASFGDLVDAAMKEPVPKEVHLKRPDHWKLIGTHVPRLDTPAKINGSALFSLDVRRPGMLTAVIQRPLQFGATVASYDATEAKKVDGVVEVVQLPQGIAVIARDTWSALRGRNALKTRWDTSKAEARSDEEMLADYRKLAAQARTALKRGNPSQGLASASKTLDVEFTFPYLVHAPMEPLNGTIEFHGDSAEIWMGSQLQTIDAIVVSKVLSLKGPDAVNINTLMGGGSFGRRGSPTGDLAGELAAIAKVAGGKAPIHVVWTREDDIRSGAYRPLVLHHVKAGLDAHGRIAGWKHVTVSQSIFGGTPFESQMVKDGLDGSAFEGIVDTAYSIDNFQVDAYMAKSPVTVTWYRAVGHNHTAHVMETVLDELAHLAGNDPVKFRLDLLSNQPREAAVVRPAAEKAGWGKPLPRRTGRGIAFHRSFGTRIAMVADVEVQGGNVILVKRIIAAADVGTAVNPDVVAAQIEGAIGFALANPLRNRLTFKNGAVVESNFHDYQVTRMREMPEVQVHLVHSLEHPSGIGEPGVTTVAPAIGNAIYSATGHRLRSLPFNLATIKV